MIALTEALSMLQTQLWIGFAVFLRVGATVALLPGFGEQSVPARIKLVLIIAFTLIIVPAIQQMPPAFSVENLILLVVTETVSGGLIGLGVRLFILALQTAGAIAAQSTSLSQIMGGASIEPLPAMGHVLMIGAVALAVMAGLHVKAAHLLIHSYTFLPMGLFHSPNEVADWGLGQVAYAFELAFLLATPFVLMSVLYNLALGVINKAMPQLMVAFVGAPLITLGGLFLLLLAAPLMLSVWLSALDQFMASPFEAGR
ncbi:flagellar biosynthesis protein FliR [Tateyamaria omphalii]|uniref:flagellar biosynthetic protein FliR n=1 Tax=Tateyamaria omphalii TaxID=299262 RepID=UPI0016787C22|nr:flagellar biosynthetic protein FliR [Tateyamaria omphalii]GGX38356.1 flagellar biosynthesis protein FliR [Tateyamaria omphalii]